MLFNTRSFFRRHGRWIARSFSFCAGAVVLLVIFFSVSPGDFPQGTIVKIKEGTYLSQAADKLAGAGVIRSPFLFKVYVVLASGRRQIQAGEYLMGSPQSALRIAYRLSYGIEDTPKIKVTISEGLTSKDIAAIVKRGIPRFDAQTFMALAKPYEGMLFPDTYYFYADSSPDDVLDALRGTFADKVKPLLLDIQAFGKPLPDVIAMASIVEREATSTADRKIIAGILWRRISQNMPLQVDPPFYYLLGKDSAHLTMSDLAVDSPYNLYKHTGLPPTPIDNPGLDAIRATIDPTPSNYLFFLSGRDGTTHYAATLAGHMANRNKYLE